MRWIAIAIVLTGCISPLVGAECRPGRVACDGRCVDLASDPQRCGACEAACGAGEACVDGVCAGAVADGGVPVSDDAGAAAADAGERAPSLRPEITGPQLTVPAPTLPRPCGLGELACDGRCVRADRDPEHCGACGSACGAGEVCAAGACAASCAAPLVACGALCVDTQRDPDHCGGCGLRCDTGVCVDGACESAFAGHLVIVGHDYTSRRAGMSRIAGNAALLPSRRVVRVVGYEGSASSESRGGTIAAIDATAEASGRAWEHEVVAADRVSYRLAFTDVFVVHAQRGLTASEALRLGHQWAPALAAFLERGGTVVALVSAAEGAGTLDILASAGLLEETLTGAPADITGSRVTVARSWDAVAVGVPLAYRAEQTTVRLPLSLDAAVITDGVGPVVVHRAIAPR